MSKLLRYIGYAVSLGASLFAAYFLGKKKALDSADRKRIEKLDQDAAHAEGELLKIKYAEGVTAEQRRQAELRVTAAKERVTNAEKAIESRDANQRSDDFNRFWEGRRADNAAH